jgi:hypothetical protein
MRMPGFTAEDSAYGSSRGWRAASRGLGNTASSLVIPQLIVKVIHPLGFCFVVEVYYCSEGCIAKGGSAAACCAYVGSSVTCNDPHPFPV